MKKNKKPILGIDASRSTCEHPTGVERYSSEMISAILDAVDLDEIEARLYTPKWIESFPRGFQRRIRLPRLWSLVRLSLEMLLHKPEYLFVPAHVLPFFAPKRSFVTIHDVAFEKYPMAYGAFQSYYLAWSTKRALKRAEKVIVPTQAVLEDLKKYYKADASRIEVIPHGRVKLLKVNDAEIKESLNHYQLPDDEPIFFFIGRLETKKNLLVLLEAWAKVQAKSNRGRLFLGGMYGHGFSELFERMEADDIRGTVLAPGYISDKEVAAIFQSATALVFPSREEGFGLPVLQSFEADCAVICSNIPALKEVAGDAALYADPGDAEGFAAHILSLIKRPELKSELVKRGEERLKEFSWDAAARKMLNCLR